MELGSTVWWDTSWNVVAGCKPVSPGCTNCVAAQRAGTLMQQSGAERATVSLYAGMVDKIGERYWFNGTLTAAPSNDRLWTFPLDWPGADNPVMGPGQPSLIFVVGMGDLFVDHRPTAEIDRIVATIAISKHIGLFLTKYTRNMAKYFAEVPQHSLRRWQEHMWLGFSAEDQRWFDARWADMRALANAGWTTFVSIAPMLGPVKLPDDFLAPGPRGWVICSGEQGPHRFCRDMDHAWARALRDQCREAGVPFFMKQMPRREANPIPFDLISHRFPQLGAQR
jgi:protein gp37